MDELTDTLEGILDDTRLPPRPTVASLKTRNRRRMQRRTIGSAVVVLLLVLGLVLGLMAGRSPHSGISKGAVTLTAFKAGKAAFARAGGPPVFSFGVIGPTRLWVLNGDGLFISTDRASSFTDITPPNLGGSPITRVLAVQFLNAADGFVLTNTSEGPTLGFEYTTNGGSSWSSVSLPTVTPGGIGRTTMDFVNQEDGFLAVRGYSSTGAVEDLLLTTTDGGSTWTIENQQSPVVSIEFTGTKTGWGLDETNGENHLYRTIDGGTSWSQINLPLSSDIVWELPSFVGSNGVVIGRPLSPGNAHPEIAVTNDGGSSWDLATAPPFSEPTCTSQVCAGDLPFTAVSSTRWIYWSGLELYSTSNAGRNWDEVLPNIAFPSSGASVVNVVTGSVYSNPTPPIAFASAADGWAIASSGRVSLILGTRDGGRQFAAFSAPSATP